MIIINFFSMTEQIYRPKFCAFHPKEYIVNFCKNAECLLPLCPTCIKVHTDQHKAERTYGQFQNICKVVTDLNGFFAQTVKDLGNSVLDIKEQQLERAKEQEGLKKKIAEAKNKMLTIVERFFTDFEKQVGKSILLYNESMKENHGKVINQIEELKTGIQQKVAGLSNDKVLKVLISFHAKSEEKKYTQQVQSIQSRIKQLDSQRVQVLLDPAAIQSVIDEMGNYIHLSFQNWQNQIKYASQFVKTGFVSTGQSGFAFNR